MAALRCSWIAWRASSERLPGLRDHHGASLDRAPPSRDSFRRFNGDDRLAYLVLDNASLSRARTSVSRLAGRSRLLRRRHEATGLAPGLRGGLRRLRRTRGGGGVSIRCGSFPGLAGCPRTRNASFESPTTARPRVHAGSSRRRGELRGSPEGHGRHRALRRAPRVSHTRKRGMIGGEDSLLSLRARTPASGFTIRAHRAWHKMSAQKLTRTSFLRRNFWEGSHWSRCCIFQAPLLRVPGTASPSGTFGRSPLDVAARRTALLGLSPPTEPGRHGGHLLHCQQRRRHPRRAQAGRHGAAALVDGSGGPRSAALEGIVTARPRAGAVIRSLARFSRVLRCARCETLVSGQMPARTSPVSPMTRSGSTRANTGRAPGARPRATRTSWPGRERICRSGVSIGSAHS